MQRADVYSVVRPQRAVPLRSLIAVIPAAVFCLGCCQREPASPPGPQPKKPAVQITKALKVKVSAGGDITADGQPVTLEQLARKLTELKGACGGGLVPPGEPGGGSPPERGEGGSADHGEQLRCGCRPSPTSPTRWTRRAYPAPSSSRPNPSRHPTAAARRLPTGRSRLC